MIKLRRIKGSDFKVKGEGMVNTRAGSLIRYEEGWFGDLIHDQGNITGDT